MINAQFLTQNTHTNAHTRTHARTSASTIESYIHTYLHALLCSYYVPGTELGTEVDQWAVLMKIPGRGHFPEQAMKHFIYSFGIAGVDFFFYCGKTAENGPLEPLVSGQFSGIGAFPVRRDRHIPLPGLSHPPTQELCPRACRTFKACKSPSAST